MCYQVNYLNQTPIENYVFKILNPIRFLEIVEELLSSPIECTWDDDVGQMEIHYLIRSIWTSLCNKRKPICQYDHTYWYKRRQKAMFCSLLNRPAAWVGQGISVTLNVD
jgi:hypothetical protein